MALFVRVHNGRKALLALIQQVEGIIEHKVVAAAESKRIHSEGGTDVLIELSRPFSKFWKLSQFIHVVRKKLPDPPTRLFDYVSIECEMRRWLRGIFSFGIDEDGVIKYAAQTGFMFEHCVIMTVVVDIELRHLRAVTVVVERERPFDRGKFFMLVIFQLTKCLQVLVKNLQHVFTNGLCLAHHQTVRLGKGDRWHKEKQGHNVD